ncbi:hypothetical protein COT50_00350, partial [candidate division WWE3 bacterium CG08_land_8_20_14_0_20_41_10]
MSKVFVLLKRIRFFPDTIALPIILISVFLITTEVFAIPPPPGWFCGGDGNLFAYYSPYSYTCPSRNVGGVFYSGCGNTGACAKHNLDGSCLFWVGACCFERPEICASGGASLSCETGNQINPKNVLNILDNDRYEFGYQIPCDNNCGCSNAKVGSTEGNLASPFRTDGDTYRSCISDTGRDCKNENGWRYSSTRNDPLNLHRIYITKKNMNCHYSCDPVSGNCNWQNWGSWTDACYLQCPDPMGIVSKLTVAPNENITFTIHTNIPTVT